MSVPLKLISTASIDFCLTCHSVPYLHHYTQSITVLTPTISSTNLAIYYTSLNSSDPNLTSVVILCSLYKNTLYN